MAHQSERTRHRNSQSAPQQGIENALKVLKLGREGVVPEAIRQRELTAVVDTAPAEVESDRAETGAGQTLGQVGEHSPILEALEPMDDKHGRSRCVPARRSNINENLSQRSGQSMLGKGRSSHR